MVPFFTGEWYQFTPALKSIKRLSLKTYLPKIVDFERFFQNSIGITRYDDEPEDITIAVTPHQSKYLATQPLHPTQMLMREEDEWIFFKFHLVPTPEFTATLLGWGEHIKVQEPGWYKKEIAEKIEKMAGLYR